MSFATILSRSSVRVLVCRRFAARYRTGVGGRGSNQCSIDRVSPLRRVSVPIGVIPVRVSVPVLSTVRLGSACACPRTVRMSGLSVVVLWSDFAMLQEGKKGERRKETPVSQSRQVGGRSSRAERTLTSQFTAVTLAFAQALEQNLCNTPEAVSNHLGCRWQFYQMEGVRKQNPHALVATSRTSHMLFWFVLLMLFALLLLGFFTPVPVASVGGIPEDCPFPGFGGLGKIEGGSKGKVLWIA